MESCPTKNELGLRENPVCLDGVDTTQFQNFTSLTDPTAIAKAVAVGACMLSPMYVCVHNVWLRPVL